MKGTHICRRRPVHHTNTLIIGYLSPLIIIPGHSCLVPLTSLSSNLKALYVFVEIGVDSKHLTESLKSNLEGPSPVTRPLLHPRAADLDRVPTLSALHTRKTLTLPVWCVDLLHTHHSLPPRVPDGHHPVRQRRARGGRAAPGPLRVRTRVCVRVCAACPSWVSPQIPTHVRTHSSVPAPPDSQHHTMAQPKCSGVTVPQARPLSAGEVLGCTAPKLDAAQFDTLVFVADGRFHLEVRRRHSGMCVVPASTSTVGARSFVRSFVPAGLKSRAHDVCMCVRASLQAAMIANPSLEAFRYNPYDKSLTREHYETGKMLQLRRWGPVEEVWDGGVQLAYVLTRDACTVRFDLNSEAVEAGRRAQRWGVILGTLGRQVSRTMGHVCRSFPSC